MVHKIPKFKKDKIVFANKCAEAECLEKANTIFFKVPLCKEHYYFYKRILKSESQEQRQRLIKLTGQKDFFSNLPWKQNP